VKAPFPWFGGKSRQAADVWDAMGEVDHYVEPFFGSGAVLLNRPGWHPGTGWVETINDKDGMVSNFWRAVQAAPEEVAHHADWPVLENDLHARHAWLVGRKESMQAMLEGDPEWYDARAAGWWCWGISCWIGGHFCSGQGPWQVEDGQLVHLSDKGQGVKRQLVHLGDKGRGVKRQRVHLGDKGRGVNRQLVHLSNKGQGVKRQRVHLGNKGLGVNRQRVHLSNKGLAGDGECGLVAWMDALSQRLARARVCCGDWTRVCGGDSGDSTSQLLHFGTCGVFLDPPYSAEAGRDECYNVEDLQVAHAAREWAIRHGENPAFRIVLCGYEGEHEMPEIWRVVEGKAGPGYAQVNKDKSSRGHANRSRERMWLSPHCERQEEPKQAIFDFLTDRPEDG
jgi:hypothetical protein